MFGWEFPPHISGGLGTACFGMTRALVQQGVEVVFVLPKMRAAHPRTHVDIRSAAAVSIPWQTTHTAAFLARLKVHEIESLLRPYLTEQSYLRALDYIRVHETEASLRGASVIAISGEYGPNLFAEMTRYSDAAEILARKENFDVIHAHDWMTFLAGVRARAVSGKPLVIHVHATEFDRSGENINQAVYDLERFGMHAADRIIAVSHYTRSLIIQRYGIPPGKVAVVHNAVNRGEAERIYHLKRAMRGKVVLFLGRVTFQKGPDYFVEAAGLVLRKMPDVTFVMAGSGDMLPRMVERVGQLRIGRNFHFTGFLHGPDVERIFALTDLYVMPSVSEPFGIAPLEAMVYDIPVIISRHAGVAEVLKHALKVDFWDIRDLANKIVAVLRYPALHREMLRNCRRELRQVRWETAGMQIKNIYSSISGAN